MVMNLQSSSDICGKINKFKNYMNGNLIISDFKRICNVAIPLGSN